MAASNTSGTDQQSRSNRGHPRPVSEAHYAAVLREFEAPFASERLAGIQGRLLRCAERDGLQPVDETSLRAKVYLGQELKLREVHLHCRPLRHTETTVRGGLPSAEDVLNEKRAWLEADTRRYWDVRGGKDQKH